MSPALHRTPWRPPWLAIAAAGCFVFGLCLILNEAVRSDGTWPLYGAVLLHGVKLYSGLHLPLQPLYILLTAAWMRFFGPSWIAQFPFAALQLALLLAGYVLLVRRHPWPAHGKAIVLAGIFFTGIGFKFYLFDDFRVLPDALYVFSAALLAARLIMQAWRRAAILGLLAGLAFATRPNDGLLLLIADALAMLALLESRRAPALAALVAAFAITVVGVVLATGDSLAAWKVNTLVASAAIKGGTGQLALSPLLLAWRAASFAVQPMALTLLALVAAMLAAPWTLGRLAERDPLLRAPPVRWTLILLVGAMEAYAIFIGDRANANFFVTLLGPYLMLALIGCGLLALLRVVRLAPGAPRGAALMLLPAAALASGSMSSGGHFEGVYNPLALFLAVTPIAFPETMQRGRLRYGLIGGCAILAAGGAWGKVLEPATWEYYQAAPMFQDRAWISQPVLGQLYVENRDAALFGRVCAAIGGFAAKTTLLSVPYPHANYYCGVPAWKDYVQTWFDTAGAVIIQRLIADIDAAPPDWILYERQPKYLRMHEVYYFHGAPLPQRDLDNLIMRRIGEGQWRVVLAQEDQPGDLWLLIRTNARAEAEGAKAHG